MNAKERAEAIAKAEEAFQAASLSGNYTQAAELVTVLQTLKSLPVESPPSPGTFTVASLIDMLGKFAPEMPVYVGQGHRAANELGAVRIEQQGALGDVLVLRGGAWQ